MNTYGITFCSMISLTIEQNLITSKYFLIYLYLVIFIDLELVYLLFQRSKINVFEPSLFS